MKLRTLGRALLRRWYVLVAGLLAVGGLSYYLYGAVPVDYKTTGSVVLLPSTESVGKGGNPYLFLTGLGQAMDVLSRRMSAPDVTKRLTNGQPSASYTALPDVTSGSSILVITVSSGSNAHAQAIMTAVLADVPAELKTMQDELNVPQTARITSMQVAEPTAPLVSNKPRVQATGAAGAAGLLLVILATALLDGLLLRRSLRAGKRNQKTRGTGTGGTEAEHIGKGARDSKLREEPAEAQLRSPVLVPAADNGDRAEFDDLPGEQEPERRQRRVSSERG